MRKSKLILLASAATIMGLAPAIASAADQPQTLETVVVTARKKSEELLKIPVAVSALTSKDIAARGIETLDDIANFTPGLTDDQANAGGARADRSFQSLIIRGMTPSTVQNPTTSIFINGAPVSIPDMIQNLDDVDRVEVLKGPQTAYFGRDTFAGAVNIITKAPSKTFTGTVSAEVGTRDTRAFGASFSGPIIADKLGFEAGVNYNAHDGSYKNAEVPGQLLGDQSTKSAHLAITAHPIENLTVKAFAEILQDDDGPAATGLLLGSQQGNCTINATKYFCGVLPGLSSISPAQNTTTAGIPSFVAQNPGIIKPSDTVQGFGLKRDAYHVDLNIEYVIPSLGLTVTSLTAFNHSAFSEISDLSNIDGAAPASAFGGAYGTYVAPSFPLFLPSPGHSGYPGFPFIVEGLGQDASQEFRVATDQSKPYRATLGVSYVNEYAETALGGIGGPYGGDAVQGPTGSKTAGVYFGLAYDILPQLTVNFDGRYQVDRVSAYNSNGSKYLAVNYYNFLPRASIQYKFTPDVMAYFTYSQGVNPGTFNTQVLTLNTAEKAELTAAEGPNAATVALKPEDLTNYELGFKGAFFDRTLTLSTAIYYDVWTNQINTGQYLFTSTNPALNPTAPLVDLFGFSANSASSLERGIEFEARWLPITHVTLNLSGSLNDARYTKYECYSCAPYGPYNAKGKELPYAPKYSLAAGAQYSNTLNWLDASDWFARVDFVFRSGLFLQPTNVNWTQDVELVNIRAGINWKGVSLEGYVNNLFNNKSYTSGFNDFDFTTFANNSPMLGLPQLITGGVKLKYKF